MIEPDDIRRHGDALQSLARALVRQPDVADDVVQDAWLAALQARGSRAPRSLVAWMRTVVRRGAARTHRAPRTEALENDPIPRAEPSASAESVDAVERLTAALQRLPESYRDVVVRRYWFDQPPRRIAEELGVEVRVVRNRLARALARLRSDLEPDGLHALSAVFLATTLSTRTSVTLPAWAVAATMTSKILVATLVVAVLALVWVLPLSEEIPTPALNRTAQADLVATTDAESPADLTAGTATASARRDAAPEAAVPTTSGDGLRNSLPAEGGTIRLRVLDGLTGAATEAYALHLDGEGLQRRVPGEALSEFRWRAGSYTALIVLPGFDPKELATFEVRDGEETDLGAHRLRPGDAHLEGYLRGAEEAPYRVSLHGIGRRPQPCCATRDGLPCATCGYGDEVSVREVVGQRRFSFGALASGRYDLVVRDAGDRVVATRSVEIAAGANAWVEISLAFKDVEVWLTDAQGEPFDGVWSEDGDAFQAAIRMQGWAGNVLVTTCDAEPQGDFEILVQALGAKETISVDDPSDAATVDVLDPDGTSLGDRWPEALTGRPRTQHAGGFVRRLVPGRFRLVGVPVELDQVQVACGPFVTAPKPVELQPGVGEVVELVVSQRCGIRTRDLQEAVSTTCTSCHAMPGTR